VEVQVVIQVLIQELLAKEVIPHPQALEQYQAVAVVGMEVEVVILVQVVVVMFIQYHLLLITRQVVF